jgi:PPM family protein phosphatase
MTIRPITAYRMLSRVLRASGMSDKGRVRPTNEDYFVVDERLRLSVVADGLGGHNAGEVAARIAVDAIVEFIGRPADCVEWPFGFDDALSRAGNLVRTAIHLANLQVLEAAGTSAGCAGMGTTIVAALVEDSCLIAGHVGDSRLYLLSRGRLRQLTDDDSWMASMLAQNPEVDPIVLLRHPMRNALTNVIGTKPRTDVHIVEQPLTAGDVMLLTTDGIHGVLNDRRMEEMLLAPRTVEETAETLVGAALACGSRDNCTAVVGKYLER